jgi:PAS domain S-box-containing protein
MMNNGDEIFRVLVLEDNEEDFKLIKNQLISEIEGHLEFKVVIDKTGLKKALKDFQPDVVLSSNSLPQLNGFEALKITVAYDKILPFIIVTDSFTEEMAVESIKLGAWDYVVKERIHRLPRAFSNAIKLKKEKLNTRRVAAELKLIKQKESMQLKLLWDAAANVPNSLVITDIDGFIIYANKRFEKISGFSTEEVIGKKPNILKSGLHDNEVYKNLWNTILAGNEWRGELINKKKNGELFWEEVSISPIADNEGNIQYFVCIKDDITIRKTAEKELIKAKERAEANNRFKTAFLNNISHEIRTPLNGILGFASLIVEPDLTDKEKQSYLEILNSSSQRLIQTVNNILDMSLISSGNIEVRNNHFDPAICVRDLARNFHPLCKKKKIFFSLEIMPEVNGIMVTSDRELLAKILNQLLDNALKFTHKGSILFTLGVNGTVLEFSIKDTGVGIRPDAIESIFEGFVQEDGGNTRAFEGSGLGLSIVKGLSELLGGNIGVESVKGEGSTFYFAMKSEIGNL